MAPLLASLLLFPVSALKALLLASSLVLLSLLVHRWLHSLLVSLFIFPCWCTGGFMACLFPYVSFTVFALMAPLLPCFHVLSIPNSLMFHSLSVH